MVNRSRIYLGPLDSASDVSFNEHFVAAHELLKIVDSSTDVVYGAKGVGKTALNRAFHDIYSDRYYSINSVNLDDISFHRVHTHLVQLGDTTKTEVSRLSTSTWSNVLAIYCLEAVSNVLSQGSSLKDRIEKLLSNEGFKNRNSSNRILVQIERFLRIIGDIGTGRSENTPLGLSVDQYEVVDRFPSTVEATELLKQCVEEVTESGLKVLITLDGFDSVIDHEEESRKAIFSGLLSAIHRFAQDDLISTGFCFKAFLPLELTNEADVSFWDADKYIFQSHLLRWSKKDFEELIYKRLIPYSRNKNRTFPEVWSEFLPDQIDNSTHSGIKEDTFEYLLRHTLFRPRHLLVHLQTIFNEWPDQTGRKRVDPTFIPKIVAATNYRLSTKVANQMEYRIPKVSIFLQSWNGQSNSTTVRVLKERIRRIFDCKSSHDVNMKLDDLYNLGVIGFQKVDKAGSPGSKSFFDFMFVNVVQVNRSIHSFLTDDDIGALCPMFHEYCGTTRSDYGVVYPEGL